MENDQIPESPPQQEQVADPYAPPSAQVAAPVYATPEQAPLAGRGARFVAQFLNGLTMIPGGALFAIGLGLLEEEPDTVSPAAIVFIALGVIVLIALMVINLRLLARQGQSLGKKWAKVRVVRIDGSPASLGRLVGLRYIVNALIGAIPMVGSVYGLVDILFIFREDRRCIHDLIADTKVVEA